MPVWGIQRSQSRYTERSEQSPTRTKHGIIAGTEQLQPRRALDQLRADHVRHVRCRQRVWRARLETVMNCRRVVTLAGDGRASPAVTLTAQLTQFAGGLWQCLNVPADTQFLITIYFCFLLANTRSVAAAVTFYDERVIVKFWEAWKFACLRLLYWTKLPSRRLPRVLLFADLRDAISWSSGSVTLALTRFILLFVDLCDDVGSFGGGVTLSLARFVRHISKQLDATSTTTTGALLS